MKKILFSTTSFDTIDNGPALFANLLYENTINLDKYDMRIITEDLYKTPHEREKLYRLNLQQNMLNQFFYQFFRMFQYHNETLKIQKQFDFDVLIYNNAFTGVKSTMEVDKPVVVMVNDDNKLLFDKSKFKLNKTYFKYATLFKLEKKASQNADRVIVNSIYMKKLVNKIYKVPNEKIKILIKGIDLKKYNFKQRTKFSKQINLLFVKADYQRGGLFEVIDTLSLLKENDIKLTVIGPPKNTLDSIEQYIKEKGLKNYKINGPMRPEKVRNYFDQADIFCVPSHKEALGVANMEALASGIPVISTNVGGIPEVLDNGKCGWLVEPGNPNQLAKAIKECIDNPKKRIEKSTYGYQFVQKFNSDNLVDNFLKIIDKVVEGSQKSKVECRKSKVKS